jgi:hypothetical protein
LAMSTLFLHSSIRIVRQARGELRHVQPRRSRARDNMKHLGIRSR